LNVENCINPPAAVRPDAALVNLETACRALAIARTIPEVKEVHDKAAAIARYLRQQKGAESAALDADELAIRAERKLGKLLGETVRAGNPQLLQGVTIGRLPEGITRIQSHRWQRIASVSDEEFERELAKARSAGKRATPTVMLRLAASNGREAKRQANRFLVENAPPLDGLPHVFQAIVVDPPWDWGDEGDVSQLGRGDPTFVTMSLDELRALPVGRRAADDCHLYLWITNRSLLKGSVLLDAWGFRYVTCLTWYKPSFGMGNYFRGNTEQILFGVRGSLGLLRKDVGTGFMAPRGKEHSSKPAEFFELVESCSPGPWLEIFSRSERPGWVAWGAEV
jgi:N6-adenosine-specific RNA methylase IME4